MTIEEAKGAFDQLKAQGSDDNEILAGLYLMYQNDELNFEELEAFSNILGYEINDDFRNMSDEDKKKFGISFDEDKAEEGTSKEEIEDAKEYSKGEEGSKESEDKGSEIEEKEEVKEDKKEEDDGKAEDDEKEEAMKMFFSNRK